MIERRIGNEKAPEAVNEVAEGLRRLPRYSFKILEVDRYAEVLIDLVNYHRGEVCKVVSRQDNIVCESKRIKSVIGESRRFTNGTGMG
jgi:hypothetical protein